MKFCKMLKPNLNICQKDFTNQPKWPKFTKYVHTDDLPLSSCRPSNRCYVTKLEENFQNSTSNKKKVLAILLQITSAKTQQLVECNDKLVGSRRNQGQASKEQYKLCSSRNQVVVETRQFQILGISQWASIETRYKLFG